MDGAPALSVRRRTDSSRPGRITRGYRPVSDKRWPAAATDSPGVFPGHHPADRPGHVGVGEAVRDRVRIARIEAGEAAPDHRQVERAAGGEEGTGRERRARVAHALTGNGVERTLLGQTGPSWNAAADRSGAIPAPIPPMSDGGAS